MKTDQRDAMPLARLLRLDEVAPVRVHTVVQDHPRPGPGPIPSWASLSAASKASSTVTPHATMATLWPSRIVRDPPIVTFSSAGCVPSCCPEVLDVRVIDAYSIKPIDAKTIRDAAHECESIVTVEDHWPEGGLGDAVLEALAETGIRTPVYKLAVRHMPGSGTPEGMLHEAGIDADGIVAATRAALRGPNETAHPRA